MQQLMFILFATPKWTTIVDGQSKKGCESFKDCKEFVIEKKKDDMESCQGNKSTKKEDGRESILGVKNNKENMRQTS